MKASIKAEPREGGGTKYTFEGDHGAFFWLLNAAGGARSGFTGNEAELDGGDLLVLEPVEKADVQPKAGKPSANRQRASLKG